MLRRSRSAYALLFFCLVSSQALAASVEATLDSWMQATLIPSVVSQLGSHPRFKDAVVRFVVMQHDEPAATTNALALTLRDKLQNAVVDQSGVRVAWQVDREKFSRHYEQDRVDCTTSTVHYYVGIELKELHSGRFSISVRALDIEDQSWVPGFGESWQGTLTSIQHRMYRQQGTDQAYLGQRSVPFKTSQTDLLAAQLAHSLGCSLLRQMSGEYVAGLSSDISDDANDTLTLVGYNLANYRALQIATDDSATNAVMNAEAHHIDKDLYQYWVTISPLDPDSDLATISASAYVYLPETVLPEAVASVASESPIDQSLKHPALLQPLEIVRLQNRSVCQTRSNQGHDAYVRSSTGRARPCYALQARTSADSVVFFLYHQQHHGLVRLADEKCSSRANARIARRDQALLLPLTLDTSGSAQWLPASGWTLDPVSDTYYAVASTNSKAARALAKHFELLPKRCGAALRAGMEDVELRRWFKELEAIAGHWRTEIDWQSVRVRNVF